LALDFQRVLLFSKFEPVEDKGLCRLHRMQGFPLEGYQPLPPNPPEDKYRGEVENPFDVGNVVTPSLDNQEGALVTVENPTPHTISLSVTPLEPLLLRLDSLGNIIDEEVPQLPARDFTETYMASIEPTFGDDYRTHVRPTTAVDTNPTPAHSIWRTSSGCDLYENFESFRQPFNPHDPPIETGPSGQTMNHSIDLVINPIVTSAQVHPNAGLITSTHSQGTSIPTPTFTNFHSTTPHVPQDPVEISFHLRMQTLASQIQSIGGKASSSGPIPPRKPPSYGGPTPPRGQPPFHVLPEGRHPFSSHTPIVNPLLAGGKPLFVGNPSQSWGLSSVGTFTQPHVGGHSYHNPQGGVSNHVPSGPSYGQAYPSVPNTTWSLMFILPKGLMFILPLMCTHLQDPLLTLLKGNMFILFMGKKITQLIMLRTHQVMQMFLNHHQTLLILVSNNCM
jgi:hypothetical protein